MPEFPGKIETSPIDTTGFKSLNKMIAAKRQEDSSSPSRSWIYNSVKMACDWDVLKGFPPYAAITPSHKILLPPAGVLNFLPPEFLTKLKAQAIKGIDNYQAKAACCKKSLETIEAVLNTPGQQNHCQVPPPSDPTAS